MSPSARAIGQKLGSFPRVSGDEPLQAAQKASQERFSPRERG